MNYNEYLFRLFDMDWAPLIMAFYFYLTVALMFGVIAISWLYVLYLIDCKERRLEKELEFKRLVGKTNGKA